MGSGRARLEEEQEAEGWTLHRSQPVWISFRTRASLPTPRHRLPTLPIHTIRIIGSRSSSLLPSPPFISSQAAVSLAHSTASQTPIPFALDSAPLPACLPTLALVNNPSSAILSRQLLLLQTTVLHPFHLSRSSDIPTQSHLLPPPLPPTSRTTLLTATTPTSHLGIPLLTIYRPSLHLITTQMITNRCSRSLLRRLLLLPLIHTLPSTNRHKIIACIHTLNSSHTTLLPILHVPHLCPPPQPSNQKLKTLPLPPPPRNPSRSTLPTLTRS
jgi:hypothetical protein